MGGDLFDSPTDTDQALPWDWTNTVLNNTTKIIVISLYGKITKTCDLKIFNRYVTAVNSASVSGSFDPETEILHVLSSEATVEKGFLKHNIIVGGGHYSQDDCVITVS